MADSAPLTRHAALAKLDAAIDDSHAHSQVTRAGLALVRQRIDKGEIARLEHRFVAWTLGDPVAEALFGSVDSMSRQ